jgi:hypothetical protein
LQNKKKIKNPRRPQKKLTQMASDIITTELPDLAYWRSMYMTPRIMSLIHETKDIEPIPRFFIIDAVLSNRFDISLQVARSAWQKELDAAQRIHESIQIANKKEAIPRIFQCARFALHVLKNLMQRGLTYTMLSYSLTARNFIVGLVRTSQCVCLTYTLYVQAIVNHFGYDDYISECYITGHVFNLTNVKDVTSATTKDLFEIGFEAGYFKNNMLVVKCWGNLPYSWERIKKLLDWDEKFFRQVLKPSMPECLTNYYWANGSKTKNSRLAADLWMESGSKKTFVKNIRNRFIITDILAELGDPILESSLLSAKQHILYECSENQVLSTILDKKNQLPIVSRLSQYNEVQKLEVKNDSIFTPNYGISDKEIGCARFLLLGFSVAIRTWTLDQLQALVHINDDYLNIIQKRKNLVQRIFFERVDRTYIFKADFDTLGTSNVSIFSVTWAYDDKDFIILIKDADTGSKLYCSMDQWERITTEDKEKFHHIVIPFLKTYPITICTYDFPENDQLFEKQKIYKAMKDEKLKKRIESIKDNTFLAKRHAKLQVRFAPKHPLTYHDLAKQKTTSYSIPFVPGDHAKIQPNIKPKEPTYSPRRLRHQNPKEDIKIEYKSRGRRSNNPQTNQSTRNRSASSGNRSASSAKKIAPTYNHSRTRSATPIKRKITKSKPMKERARSSTPVKSKSIPRTKSIRTSSRLQRKN